MQEKVLLEVQTMVTLPPGVTEEGVAVREAVGAVGT
jgi:hypothetical protein